MPNIKQAISKASFPARSDVAPILTRSISAVNWNQVYSFSVVATHGSIRKGAEILALSPSSISEQISQLEQTLEVKLFTRNGPKLLLTEQGERLLIHAKSMFDQGLRLLDAVSPLIMENYPLAIGFVPGPHLPSAYGYVTEMQRQFGPLNMKLQHCPPDTFETSILKGQVDFGFSDRKSIRGDLLSFQIAVDPVHFYVSNEWQHHSLSQLLEELPLLICRSEASTEAFVEQALRKVGITPASVISSDFPSVLIDLCRSGQGVGVFVEDSLPDLNSNKIRKLRHPKDAPRIESSLYAIWPVAAENTAAIARLKSVLKIDDHSLSSSERAGRNEQ